MTKHASVNPFVLTMTEVRRNLTTIVRKLRRKREPAIIKRGGESIAV